MKIEEMENILAKNATGEATSSELAMLDQWRTESAANQALHDEYSTLWDMSRNFESEIFNPNFESALSSHLLLLEEETSHQPNTQKETIVKSLNTNTKSQLFSIRNISSIAAIFVLGIAAIFLFGNSTTKITSENGVRFVSLEDGSKVWIDEGSVIEYESGFGVDHRNMKLTGKAFFDVNYNKSLPLSIKEADINVTVLGTSFTVDGDSDFVSVTNGSVSVGYQSETVVLTKNEETRLLNDKFETSKSVGNTGLWRNTSLSFDDSPITQVVADINMFHNDKVELEGSALSSNCTFTSGGLSTESLDNIIEILRKSFDLKVSKSENGKINLLISDCN